MTRKAAWLWPLHQLAPLADRMDAFITKEVAPRASNLSVAAVMGIIFLSAVYEFAFDYGATAKFYAGSMWVMLVLAGSGLLIRRFLNHLPIPSSQS